MKLGYYDAGKDMNNAIESNGVVKTDALNLVYTRLAADVPDDPSAFGAYFAKGGKLLIYHGYDDLIISPYSSIWFYEDLAQENGGYEKAPAERAPLHGARHAALRPAAQGQIRLTRLSALEQWVEKGIAPDAIPATHSTNNAVDRTMPLCKFPEKAHYKGSGDLNSVVQLVLPAERQVTACRGPQRILAGVSAVPPARVSAPAKQAPKSGGN